MTCEEGDTARWAAAALGCPVPRCTSLSRAGGAAISSFTRLGTSTGHTTMHNRAFLKETVSYRRQSTLPGFSYRASRAIKHELFSIASEGGQSLSQRPKEGSLDISCAPLLASTNLGAEACLGSDKFSTLNCSVP